MSSIFIAIIVCMPQNYFWRSIVSSTVSVYDTIVDRVAKIVLIISGIIPTIVPTTEPDLPARIGVLHQAVTAVQMDQRCGQFGRGAIRHTGNVFPEGDSSGNQESDNPWEKNCDKGNRHVFDLHGLIPDRDFQEASREFVHRRPPMTSVVDPCCHL
jgi:hypothetical protein